MLKISLEKIDKQRMSLDNKNKSLSDENLKL
jgi:hypothetical protein